MLSLRLLRGARPAALGRWTLVALASCGTGLLLLAALGWALAHPAGSTSDALVRLGWCVVPVVVTVQLAVAVGRTQPGAWPRSGLAAAGLGRSGVVVLAAATALVVCALGSALALLLFLQLRGDVTGVAYHGVGPGLLASGRSLPPAGAVTLLAVVPLAAAVASVARLRAERDPDGTEAAGRDSADSVPRGLPWGVALVAVGLAVEVSAPDRRTFPLPGGLGSIAPAAVGGWALVAVGLVVAGPGVVHGCGLLLAAFRPGGLRLLSGRGLQRDARRLGRPLGLLAATAAAALSGYGLHQDTGRAPGPVTVFAAALVGACVLGSTAMAALESRTERRPDAAALRELAVPATLLRASAVVRTGVLVVVFLAAALLVAALSPTP